MNRILGILTLVFLLWTANGRAQSRLVLSEMPDDTAKVGRLLYMADTTMNNNVAVLSYAEQARDLARKLGYKEGLAKALIKTGGSSNKLSDFSAASRDLLEALRLGEEMKDDQIIQKVYLNLGSTYAYSANYDKALEFFNKGLEVARATGDKRNEATFLNNIGNIHYYREFAGKQFTLSLDHYTQALSIYEQLSDTNGITMTLDNLGLVYSDQQNFPQALSVLQRSYDLAQRSGNEEAIMYCLYKFSRLYAYMKYYPMSVSYLDQAMLLAGKSGNKDMIMYGYRQYADIYAQVYDFSNAYKYQRKYSDIRDTLLSEENARNIAELQAKYEIEKKEKELALLRTEGELLKRESEISELEANRNLTIAWASGGGLFLVLMMALLLYSRYQIKNRANQRLEEQNAVIAQKNKDITDSINYAKRLQQSVIATDAFLSKHLPEYFVLYKPKDIVSGDFYWAHSPAENEVIIATADCTGHGVPGAFMSVLGASLLNDIIAERKVLHPNLALNLLRDNLVKMLNPQGSTGETRDGMDIVLCRFNFQKKILSYAAAHNVLWIARGNEMLECLADKFPVGKHHSVQKPFTLRNIQLQPGDVIYTFTDGYADQFGMPAEAWAKIGGASSAKATEAKGKKFKYKELQKLLLSIKDKPLAEQRTLLDQAFEKWKGPQEQVDDVLIMGIRV